MIKPDVFVLGDSLEHQNLDIDYTQRIPHDKITRHTFNYIKRTSSSKYFYIVKESAITNINLQADVYEHTNAFQLWNGCDAVRLFNRELVLENPAAYVDDEWHNGTIENVYNIVDSAIKVYDSRWQESYNREQCQTVLLTKDWPLWCDKLSKLYYHIIHIDSNTLGLAEIKEILQKTKKQNIYIIRADIECNGDFQVNWIPATHDRHYMHVWNNSFDLQLIARESLETSLELYTDDAVFNGLAKIKVVEDDTVNINTEYDIVYISYDEPTANENFKKLIDKYPKAQRVHGIKGILEAHKKAAHLVKTPFFYVVDADAVIVDDFKFDKVVSLYNKNTVYVWRSINPCNGLEYGYGGVKLFPTQKLLDTKKWNIDFTTSIGADFCAVDKVSNLTNFNTTSFSAWRAGFREAVKLSSMCIKNSNDLESKERLEIWTTKANDVPYANECKQGAIAGKEYGLEYATNQKALAKINDFDWLELQYEYTKHD
jgi:hypothetical protein